MLVSLGTTLPAEQVTRGLIDAKTNQLKAAFELRSQAALTEGLADFKSDCEPLAELQGRLIDQMRMGPPK